MSDYFEEIRANAKYTNMSSNQNPAKAERNDFLHLVTLIVVHSSLHGEMTGFIKYGLCK